VAQVTQETILFNDTVRNNIAYGRPDVKLAVVEEAARNAWPTTYSAHAAGLRYGDRRKGFRSPVANGNGWPLRGPS